MKPGLKLLLTVIAALGASGLAAREGMHLQRDFDRLDKNHDAQLSWSEFSDRLREMFFFADLDSNGTVSRTEASRGMARRFDGFDVNGDQVLGLEEFVDGHRASFDAADADADDALSRSEVDALRAQHRGQRGATGD